MILVDTVVWVRWLRDRTDRAVADLGQLVEDGLAAWHPIIRGELLLGADRLSLTRP